MLHDRLLVQITCGWSHTVSLSDTGEVYTWGNGDHGKLGHDSTDKVSGPQAIEALKGKHVCRVASYNEHTVALTDPSATIKPSALTSLFRADLRRLINNEQFADVTFIVEGKPLHAHRAFLAVRCDHFRAMFSSGMKEAHQMEVAIPSTRWLIFLALLEYCYTDSVDVTPEVAIELSIAADLYTLERLRGLCEVIVQKQISTENAAALLQIAEDTHATRIREVCLRFIVRDFDSVSRSESFQSLSRSLILEVLQNRIN